jgi:hypothetical protein
MSDDRTRRLAILNVTRPAGATVSTRKLILAALVCGLVILMASAIQLLIAT